MFFIADFHVHSRYSIATSKEMNPEALYCGAQLKGLSVIGTGDFTHPRWSEELREQLEPAEVGLYRLKPELAERADMRVTEACRGEVRFILTSEISNIYKKGGRTRKVHNLLFAPTLEAAGRIAAELDKIGNITYDGRPILGMDSKHLLEIVLDGDDGSFLVPAHAWTPHFSIFGAASAFTSIEECFDELASEIFAIETGLSSDPAMNWRLSQLDSITLISNSDAHSPANLAREANLFDTQLSFTAIKNAMRAGRGKTFLGTIEFFPQEGKYHYGGHRACGARMTAQDMIKHNGRCPVCGKKATIGVMHRVEELADRPEGFRPKSALPYESLVQLPGILSEVLGTGPRTKRVKREQDRLLAALGPELSILREAPLERIAAQSSELLAKAVSRVRRGDVQIEPGYDGEYGTVQVLKKGERETFERQLRLF